ncbi:MAG TPA: YdcF family protein [Candidatus Saccharimonadia bacterium]|nr:YdcF family protein [Candidatus Saccharimonadia bacterium]
MKRFVVGVGVTLCLLAVLAAVFFFGIGFYLSPQSSLAKTDAIVAISGGETNARTAEAVQLYRAGWAHWLIFSGAAADPTGPSNARAMATDAEAAGVPASAILLDETSVDTSQNAINVAVIVRDHNFHSIILVTSPYHQRRAEIAFHQALGKSFTILNHSSYDQQWRRSDWWATSYSRNLTYSELQKVAYELVTGNNQ